MDYKLSEGKRKFMIGLLVFIYLLGLVPIIYSILEFVYDKALFMPTWLIVVLTILGQVLPLGYYILHLVERDEVEDDKSRFIYSLFFAASVINRSLSSISPYRYITLYGYSPVKSWLRFLASPLLLIAVALLAWIYVLIRDKKKKSR